PEPDCGQVVNCPRYAPWWSDQFSGAGNAFTPAQLLDIAQRVNARSLYFEWDADPVASLRSALDAASATTPLGKAIRQYAAFLCTVTVSSPLITPVSGPPVFLDAGTPISCPGLDGQSIQELAGTATHGLSDASYIDAGANPTALTGFNGAGLPFFDG